MSDDVKVRADALFAKFIAERDDTGCPRCGYSLRGLSNPVCPECGDRLRLTVALAEPRLGAFITAIVALSVGLGGSMLFGSIGLKAAPRGWWLELAGILIVVQFVTTAAGLRLVIRKRRRFRRFSPRVQWLMAVGACVFVASFWGAIVMSFDK